MKSSHTTIWLLTVVCCLGQVRPPATGTVPAPPVEVFPQKMTVAAGENGHRLLVTGLDGDGLASDLTAGAIFTSDRTRVATVDESGMVLGLEAGTATITASAGGRVATVAVVVEPKRAAPLSFTHDIIPIINRAGCNAGACHAKPNGQKGFSLSVFSYNPPEDYREIVKESRGRRVFPEAPEKSLILQKPTMTVEHEGGLRFERDSEFYNKIKRWIGTGMVYANDDDPQLVAVSVYPKQRRYGRQVNQSLLVQATYSNGAVRDVTHLSVFESRDKDIVAVDANGRMKVKDRFGEAAVMARFREQVDVATITVPTDYGLADSRYETLPVNNELDTHVYAQLKRLGFFPSDTCSDSTFLRRVYLDAAGLLPTADEARAFLADDDAQKRQKLIDRLLEHPRWADHWATKWSDLIRPNDVLVGTKSVYVLDQWTREQFRQNVPYDQFVRRIITAEGNTVANGAGIVFRDRPKPEDVSELVAQVFLGVRIQCARCHHHPLEKWSQKDFYQLAAYFGQVKGGGRGGLTQRGAFIYHGGEGEIKHPLTDEVMRPTPPEGPPARLETGSDPRVALADWMSDPQNPFFARAVVNRVWAEFMGRGIVHPVDDFRVSNPPTNGPLLDALARTFVEHEFDLKHLMRMIMRSRVYQLSSFATDHNAFDTKHFSRYYRKRLPAEVLQDAVADLTQTPNGLIGMAPATRAIEVWNNKIQSHFLDAFGRPVPLDNPPCHRGKKSTLVQSLHLMNSEALQARIADERGRAARLAADEGRSVPQIVEDLYLAAYSRYPTEVELADVQRALFAVPGATRQSAVQDVMWAMVNSAEFVFNH